MERLPANEYPRLRVTMKRRDFFKAALALPATSCIAPYEAFAEPEKNRVKITDIKAMMLRSPGQTLIKIETDAGLVGYGEAGISGPAARARIEPVKLLLVGQDPLAIERHFHKLTSQMHPYRAHIPTISGIDIALWDLAGKITNLPVSTLLGGPFRDKIRLTINSQPANMMDPASCREWAQRMKEDPMGWNIFKLGYMRLTDHTPDQLASALTASELIRVQTAFSNVREAIGSAMDIIPHGHNELDLHGALGLARAVEPARPIWIEDPMPIAYSESWSTLHRSSRVPIQTGEKLEMPREFYPFLQNQAVDVIQPDLAFAGGITGTRKIADLAAMYFIPVCTHNIGTIVQTLASVHFGASIYNFVSSEFVPQHQIGTRVGGVAPVVRNSHVDVPKSPGLGVELNADVLRANLAPGEPWWG